MQKKLTVFLLLICATVVWLPVRAAFGQSATATPGAPTRAATMIATMAATRAATTTATKPATQAVTPAATQAATIPANTASSSLLAQNVTLASLGVRNAELISPQGSVQFVFRIPDNWQHDGASSLNLNVQAFLSGTAESPIASVLRVQLDNVLITSLTLTPNAPAPQTIVIPLDTGALNNSLRRTHTIQVSLDARDQCVANQEIRILIRSDLSYFHFEYRELAPVRDLANYPRPFFNTGFANQTETALIVLPTKYTTGDLEAAASVAAGFGLLTANNGLVHTTTADALSAQDQQNNNLVLIGQIGTNTLIDGLYSANGLPTRLDTNGALSVKGQPIADTDGVLQLIANPRNAMRSILTVTGKTLEGLKKAARALGGPPPTLGFSGSLALISDVRTPPAPSSTDVMTFEGLGYQDVTLNGLGTRTTEIKFSAPGGAVVGNDAYVDLDLSYATTLKTAQTTLTLMMNETLLDSVTLGSVAAESKATPTESANIQHLRASIPPNSVHPGETNTLTLVLDVQGNWKCYPPSAAVTWLTARSTSKLYLPRQKVDARFLTQQVSNFPSPFSSARDLQDTWIALPDKPTAAELDEAFRLIARLGSETPNGTNLQPHVSLGKLPAGVDVANYNFIVYGRPSTNSFLAQLNNNLPQPFAANSDDLKQIVDAVSYRLPPGYAIGVVQALKSPWSPNRSILAITGTDAEGQSKAMNVLISGNYARGELKGDVVYAASNAISTVNTTNPDEALTLSTDVPALVTQSAQIGTPTATLSSAQTVTPGPTATTPPTRTPAPNVNVTATPLFAPTVGSTPTPLPTFAPLSQADITPEQPKQPIWVTGLAIVTGVVIVLVVLFGLISLVRSRRKT